MLHDFSPDLLNGKPSSLPFSNTEHHKHGHSVKISSVSKRLSVNRTALTHMRQRESESASRSDGQRSELQLRHELSHSRTHNTKKKKKSGEKAHCNALRSVMERYGRFRNSLTVLRPRSALWPRSCRISLFPRSCKFRFVFRLIEMCKLGMRRVLLSVKFSYA